MRNADALKASWTTLCHAMQTDTRFTLFEREQLTAINIVQDAAQPTTRHQDKFIVHCMKRFAAQTENYSPV